MECGKADLILYNAKVLTCDDSNPSAEFVAVRGRYILGAGTNSDVDCYIGPDTKKIDCQGMTVIPGFNDAHCHPVSYAITKMQIDCSPAAVDSIDGIKSAFRETAKASEASVWLRGAMYNETHLKEKRHPTRQDLDEAAPGRPVILVHYTGASCVLNSVALKHIGITRETAASAGGGIEIDQATREPSGLIFGMNEIVRNGVPSLTQEELTNCFQLAAVDYLSNGITSLQDTGWDNGVGHWRTYQRMQAAPSRFPCRVTMLLGYDALKLAGEAGLTMDCGNHFLRIGGVKIALDESTGCDTPPQEAFTSAAFETISLGYRAAFHVSNLYQLESATNALKLALKAHPVPGLRHRLEHCLLCTPEHLSALRGLPLMIVTQPTIMYYQGMDFLETIPSDSLNCIMPLASFAKAGIPCACSSDSPLMPINPLLGIYEAVTRKELSGSVITPSEKIATDKALKMYTIMGAYASGEEAVKGSIMPGKLADLVVLDKDIMRSDFVEIKGTSVVMTVIDGKVAWER
jgi:predicted amidohydrolase YtcJ